jgi:(S)-3,5-dihydroxyphenylglycine transaminase
VIYICTFAKICSPGARVGFVVADQIVRTPEGNRGLLADELALIKSMTIANTSPLRQAMIGGMVLEHGGSIASLGQDQSRIYRRNLALLLQALDRHLSPAEDVAWNRPAGGFFVRMRIAVSANVALLELSAQNMACCGLRCPLFTSVVPVPTTFGCPAAMSILTKSSSVWSGSPGSIEKIIP